MATKAWYSKKNISFSNGVIRVEKYHTPQGGARGRSKAARERELTEEQAALNQRHAAENLRNLIYENFRRGDIRLDLTYRNPEPSPGEAARRVRDFIKTLRKRYRKQGEELKYIYVTEYRGHRVHHHLLINDIGMKYAEVSACWPWAKIDYHSSRHYDGGWADAASVANYLIKETYQGMKKPGSPQRVSYITSKNLTRPIIHVEPLHRLWPDRPKAPRGYTVEVLKNRRDGEGWPVQTYFLYPLGDASAGEYWKRSTAKARKRAKERADRKKDARKKTGKETGLSS